VDAVTAREARRAAQLATGGELLRLWRLPGENRALGLWQAENAERMREIAASLPLAPWLDTTTLALTRHPNDPVLG
jgi:muconolactone D-isomerase